jgi:PBP1b-binding outer membrane lipoprotein LpoB
MIPTFLDIILYDENILKNKKNNFEEDKKNNFEENKKNNFEEDKKNNFEENKKVILDSFINYPRLELIKKYKIQTYQFLMNKNYRNIFIKFLIIPLTFELSYNIYKK